MYFSTSQDLFFFILAIAIGVLTVLLAWGMIYLILILKKSYMAVREVEEKVRSIGEIFGTLREHLANSSSSLRLLVEVASQIANFFQNRKAKANGKKKTASL